MPDKSEIAATCVFCEGRDLFSLPAVIAGAEWPVCKMCAGAGRALLDEDEAWRASLVCLHLTAMEIEQFAVGYASGGARAERKWLFRIQRNLTRGVFREWCPCPTCTGGGDVIVLTDLEGEFGVVVETFADTMPLDVLKSMPDHAKLTASDGSTWRAVDEIARRLEANHLATKRPPVGPLAEAARVKAPGEWTLVGKTADMRPEYRYGPVHERRRAARDADVKRYWAGFNKFGPGYLDGDYYITEEDGECHPWPRARK